LEEFLLGKTSLHDRGGTTFALLNGFRRICYVNVGVGLLRTVSGTRSEGRSRFLIRDPPHRSRPFPRTIYMKRCLKMGHNSFYMLRTNVPSHFSAALAATRAGTL
jgi:hypothetical protein